MPFVISTLVLFLVLLLPGQALLAAPDGRTLYQEHCTACHQTEGRGGIGLPLSSSFLANVSDDYLFETIRLGRPGRIMPAFQELSEAQVVALVAYIRSWSGRPGMRFDPTPIAGDLERGRRLYEENCSRCHADDGSGEGSGTGVTLSREREFMIMPPAINNTGFLQAAPDEMIRHTIATGRRGPDGESLMPSFEGDLGDSEIDDVVAYVRSFEQQPLSPAEQEAEEAPLSHVVESPYDFETTLKNVTMALQGANFRQFPNRFLEEGLIDEFTHNTRQVSIRFCNFNKLYNMLAVEPRLGVVLPCRITVLEREDGSVLLVAPGMKAISYWFNNNELIELGSAMDEMLIAILEEATF